MFRLLLLSIVCVTCVACGPSDPPAAPTTPAPSGAPAASTPTGGASSSAAADPAGGAEDACAIDADCAVVELECCDHCNGGKVAAFHASKVAAHRPTGCEGRRCTRRACGNAVAKCVEKRCKAEIEGVGAPSGP